MVIVADVTIYTEVLRIMGNCEKKKITNYLGLEIRKLNDHKM